MVVVVVVVAVVLVVLPSPPSLPSLPPTAPGVEFAMHLFMSIAIMSYHRSWTGSRDPRSQMESEQVQTFIASIVVAVAEVTCIMRMIVLAVIIIAIIIFTSPPSLLRSSLPPPRGIIISIVANVPRYLPCPALPCGNWARTTAFRIASCKWATIHSDLYFQAHSHDTIWQYSASRHYYAILYAFLPSAVSGPRHLIQPPPPWMLTLLCHFKQSLDCLLTRSWHLPMPPPVSRFPQFGALNKATNLGRQTVSMMNHSWNGQCIDDLHNSLQ